MGEVDALIAHARRTLATREAPDLRLVDVLTSPDWFGLTTATPLQRAVCEWSEGREAHPVIETDGYEADIVERMSVGWVLGSEQPAERPREVYLLAGIRTFKSLLDACVAVHASQTVDMSRLRRNERARFSILSLDKDKARAVLMHLMGALNAPRIAPLVVGKRVSDEEIPSSGMVALRHPSGRIVEITVVAGKRAGGGLVSYWQAGVVFDEAPRMAGEADGVVNFDDSRKSVIGRLLPGAQLWANGSPWAPLGPIHKAVEKYHRKPGGVLVLRAPAPALNPFTWTPAECEAVRAADVDTFRMDVLGEWGRPESSPFHDGVLLPCLRPDGDQDPEPLYHYEAHMDPAGRTNAWTLAIGTVDRQEVRQVVLLREWRPGQDGVSPIQVLTDIRDICERYGVSIVTTDQWAVDPLQDLARPLGLELSESTATARSNHEAYAGLLELLKAKRIVLPEHGPMLDDLRRVKRRLTASGGVQWVLPVTHDGRHCDYAPVIAGLAVCVMSEPDPEPAAKPTAQQDEDEYRERLLASITAKRSTGVDDFDFSNDDFFESDDDPLEGITA